MARRAPRTKPDPRKMKPIAIRLLPDMRSRLDASRSEDGKYHRSLSEEIEQRLEKSFSDETIGRWGGQNTYAALRLIAETVKIIHQQTGGAWYRDCFTHAAVMDAVQTVFAALEPHGSTKPPAAFPTTPRLDHLPAAVRARVHKDIRKQLEGQPIGKAAAQSALALVDVAGRAPKGPETDHLRIYRRIRDDLARQLADVPNAVLTAVPPPVAGDDK